MSRAMSRAALIDLGILSRAVVVSRPSKSIKSPYVADVLLLDEVKDTNKMFEVIKQLASSVPGKTKRERDNHAAELHTFLSGLSPLHLAHAPSLDCAGMAVPGSIVYISPASSTQAKTAFTIQLCEEQRQEGNVIVGYHPALAEKALKALMEQSSSVSDFLSRSFGIKDSEEVQLSSQRTFGDSRFDFVLETSSRVVLIECKNVVGADYSSGSVPLSRSPIGVYCVEQGARSAIFPHGSGSKLPGGVISDRAIKHLDGLINLHKTKTEGGKTIESAIVFLVNRSDCTSFRPCHEADKLFAQMLHRAKQTGVRVIAQELFWSETRLCLSGKDLPVAFDASVNGHDIDPDLLRKVLEYSAVHSNDRKSPSSSTKKQKKTTGSAVEI